MSNPNFPTLTMGEDSRFFSVEQEDPAIRTNMEGGYVSSRARHTRTPRKTFTSGLTNLTNADKATLEAFWDTVRGGSVIFNWTSPQNAVVYAVRFKEPLRWKYTGKGPNQTWELQFTLEQA